MVENLILEEAAALEEVAVLEEVEDLVAKATPPIDHPPLLLEKLQAPSKDWKVSFLITL